MEYIINSAAALAQMVRAYGFLPFFRNGIPGFSIEEHTPPELWFSDTQDGPWEWKGPVARNGECVYGKFFGGKAGFVSKEWLPDFVNYRRDGYDFADRYEDGLASRADKKLLDAIAEHGVLLSKDLKRICNYRKDGNKGFDPAITRLQMQTYVTIADFVYMQDKYGRPYGWGVSQYTTPETQFGEEFVTSAYEKEPEESQTCIVEHLKSVLPNATEAQILKLIK